MRNTKLQGPNTEQRQKPEDFHSARKNKGHPQKQARRERANQRLVDQIVKGPEGG